jgi:hypothetical protein
VSSRTKPSLEMVGVLSLGWPDFIL